MMPSRVPCVSAENPLGLSWHDSNLVPMLNATNVLDYFCERSNPFYDRTCNNEIIKMQRSNPEQLTNMTGIEYFLLHAQEPILYVIRKQARQSPTQAHSIADYYIIAGTVYQAPDLVSVINSRTSKNYSLTSVFHLESAFDDLFTMMRYQPSKGYSWDIKSTSPGAGILKKDVKEEPSSNFQRQRVDMLLMELTKRFPLPVIRPPAQEEMVSEPQTSRSEPATVVKTEKMEEAPTIKEEKVESSATSPSMKPPPEKKARLN